MKKSQFRKLVKGTYSKRKKAVPTGYSVTDPTFARTGRQLIFQPLPIDYRISYTQGAPLNPDNPYNFPEFDKMYVDILKAQDEALRTINNTKNQLNDIKQKYQQQQQQQQTQN